MGAAAPTDPAPAQADNSEGFWEPVSLVREMEALLAKCDSAWFDFRPLDLMVLGEAELEQQRLRLVDALRASFPDAQRFVIKDPRVCRAVGLLCDALRPIAGSIRVILALRGVRDVAASLRRRDQISIGYAGLVWARHMRDAETATRHLPRLVVHYDQALSNPGRLIDDLKAFMPWATVIDADKRASIIRSDLRHNADPSEFEVFGAELGPALRGFQTALLRLIDQDDDAARTQVDVAWLPVFKSAKRLGANLHAEFAVLRLTGRHMLQPGSRDVSDMARFMEAMEKMLIKRF